MQTTVIACETIRTEVFAAMEKAGAEYPIVWMESGLHNTPKLLNARLSELLAEVSSPRVLLAMGFCGNSLTGLQIGNHEIIVPRADDCISVLLGSVNRRVEVSAQYAAYFLTMGWMRGERNLWVEYQTLKEDCDEDELEDLVQMMYGHYRTLGLLDTGTEDMDKLLEITKCAADTLHMKQEILPATLDYLVTLFTGPWPEERFLTKAPGTVITAEDLHF